MGKSIERHKLNIFHAFLAALTVLALFVLVSVICRITPFGDKTFLMGDLKRQYVDYYAYLKTILSGENDPAYSFSTTLGSGISGFFAYYLSSPFLAILTLFPRTAMPVGISIVICLKLMLAAFVMELFLQRFVNAEGILMCSVSWAFSGYLFAHSMNMMWMDVVIMLPLAVWSVEHLLDKNRKVPYIAVLALMLAFNYYITYQVLIFLAMWTLVRVFVRGEENKPLQVFRVFIATVTAVCIDAIMLVPTALELLNSPKDIAQLGLKLTGKNLSAIDVFSKSITCSYDILEPRFGFPQIFCGLFMIFLFLMFFVDKGIPRAHRIGMLVMFLILLLSFCLDALNVLWHAGMEPSGHPYRQAYIWTFLVICCCAGSLSRIKENLEYHKIIGIFGTIVIFLVVIARGNYDHAPLKVIMINFALVTLYFALLWAVAFCEKKGRKNLAVIVTVVILLANFGDLSLNAARTYGFLSTYAETESFYRDTISKNLAAVNFVKDSDSSFYRMENLNPRQQNDSLQYNYNGVTHYSSAGMIYVRRFLQRIGFNDDGLYTHYGHDNTALADMLLGIKYVLTDGTYKAHADYNNIYDREVSVYENPWALSVAVETTGFNLEGIADPEENEPDASLSHVPSADAFSLQEEILSRIMGKELPVFEPAAVESSSFGKNENNKYSIDHTVTAAADGELYMYLDGLIGAREGLVIYIDGEMLSTYGNASCVKILNLGYKKAGEKLIVRVEGETKSDDLGKPLFVTENTGALEKAYEEINDRNCEVIKKASSRLELRTGNCDGVFTTIPYETGWKVKVDGKDVSAVAVYDSFIYIPVTGGGDSHVIEMSFEAPGAMWGRVITIAGLVMLVLVIILEKRKPPRKRW